MHAAGMRPRHLDLASVPAPELAAERALLREQAAAAPGGAGKPAAVLDKIVEGRMAKWAQEACLNDQRFVLDDSTTVGQLLRSRALRAAAFARVQVGEGLEAEAPAGGAKSFADEVAEMAAGGRR